MNRPEIPTLKPIRHHSDTFQQDAREAERLVQRIDAGELSYDDLSDRQWQLIDDHCIGHDALGQWLRGLSDEHLSMLSRGEPVPNIPEALREQVLKELSEVQ